MMIDSPTRYRLFAAVAIAAASFAANWTTGGIPPHKALTFAQSPHGFSAFQDRLRASDIPPAQTLIVLFASGSYWVALAVALHQAGFVVSVLNPAKVHNYALSLARRAKTDALDATLLAQFAAERQPTPCSPPPPLYHELRQRLLARDLLLTMRQQTRNQRHALLQWPVVIEALRQQLDGLLAELELRLSRLEAELAAVLKDAAWAESAALLSSINAIGLITSAWLVVGTLNFTLCASGAAAAAYAGLVPLSCNSGTSVRERARIGQGGQARLRTALYRASLSAARFNPVIQAQYQRLRAAGKSVKVARCAAARKLMHLAYAVVSKEKRFDPHYGTARA